MTSGYSVTPLAKKLSMKDGMRVWWDAVPVTVRAEIATEGLEFEILSVAQAPIDAAHVFVVERATLEAKLHQLMPLLGPSGFIWVSWPKKASKVPTDITEDVLRELLLPTGWVDNKVCAIDDTWSGLRFALRVELR